MIPFKVDALGMVPKGREKRLLELENRGRIETIQTTTLLKIGFKIYRCPWDLRRLSVTDSSERASIKFGVKHLQRRNE